MNDPRETHYVFQKINGKEVPSSAIMHGTYRECQAAIRRMKARGTHPTVSFGTARLIK